MTNLFKKNEPLKNITNFTKQQTKKSIFTKEEEIIYKSHFFQEKDEICMCSNYSDLIFDFYKQIDTCYIYKNSEVSFIERSYMIDWLINIHFKLNLCQDTLFFAVYIIDKFLLKKEIPKNKLQLVGLSALMISCKFEEVICPTLNNLTVLSDNKVTEDDIKKAEKYMLHILEYNLIFSNPLNFLRKCSKSNNYERNSRTVAKYILELSLLYEDLTVYTGSIKAASAMYLARKITQQDTCKNLFTLYSGHTKIELRDCFNKMIVMIAKPIPFENIFKKYDTQKFGFVSTFVKEYALKNFY